MAKYTIEGGGRLSGDLKIHGAKNSVLPILAATLLTKESTIHNCPALTDVDAACNILRHLGCKADRENGSIHVVPGDTRSDIPDALMREMRSSVVFLGAIIARSGEASVSLPGGCELGPRPIDLHISALRRLGVRITEENGSLKCHTKGRLKGASIHLPFPSVGATENAILAACTAEGSTVIHNAAREPEIEDLVGFLNAAGADVRIGGNGSVFINGVDGLDAVDYAVIPDRIAGATYLCCAAITGGELLLTGAEPKHMEAIFPMLEQAGAVVKATDNAVYLRMRGRPKPIKLVRTMPYPGFPTDAQSPLMAVSCIASGVSVYVENIFESRYKHVDELIRMGAKIGVEGRVAVVEGVRRLSGAAVKCTDLRGGAALVVAALAAEGMSEVTEIHHIERGYQDFDHNLRLLGANIQKGWIH